MSKFKVNNYKLGKLLGMGTFGIVRLGINEITNQQVAVKIINKRKFKQMKVREKTFYHPHVVKLYEYFDTKEDVYFVFEYVPNGELFDLISDKGQLEENEARKYFHQLIYALNYIHSFGVAHRDLKPENILLDENYNIKIGDFGLSNNVKEGRSLKTSWGSPNYAAPEVINGKPYDGLQIDVWSWGVILYAMLYGELPFDEENVNTTFKYIKEARYYMKGNTSPAVKDLLNRMIQPNPYKRITISEIIEHPWFQKNQVYKYLLNQWYAIPGFNWHKSIDKNIVDKLMKLKFDTELKDRSMVEKAIAKGEMHDFWIVYEYLYHSKLLEQMNDKIMYSPKHATFNKIQFKKGTIRSINLVHKRLSELDNDEIENIDVECKPEAQTIPVAKSFHTNSSSTEYLKGKIGKLSYINFVFS